MSKYKYFLFIFLFSLLTFQNCTDQGDQPPEKVDPITPKPEYTEEEAGEWEEIKGEHVPRVTIRQGESMDNIIVDVPGRNFNNGHYIERVGIMNSDKQDYDSAIPENRLEPKVFLTLKPMPDDLKKVKVYVKCNLHDLWTVSLHKVLHPEEE